MKKLLYLIFLVLTSGTSLAEEYLRKGKDTANIYRKIDTTFIHSYRDMLNVKLITSVRTNVFSLTNKLTKESIEYSITNKVNFGVGLSFKAIGLEVQFSPKALNQNDALYGKTTQFSLATGGHSRRFIYDVYYRYSEGYHTTKKYKFGEDTVETYYKRPDIINNNIGINIIYIFNNKKFSSSAPYSLTQKQRKSAGSFLLGTYAFAYTLSADTVILPDTMYKQFKPSLQFQNAASLTWGVSCGYTYTLVFLKNCFFNIATIPGISVQEFYSENSFTKEVYNRSSASLSLQSRFSMGINKPRWFLGLSWANNKFLISDDKEATLNYKFGVFRFYYGYRFDLRKALKKTM
jgi:hypothetical protein